mmetsp:Transcript_36679/g.57266  ORF Transcript_36679/g.57266 Transcript_36679/m.57266 type:complete len:285 (+) Transcript_36679:1658-2512(+)
MSVEVRKVVTSLLGIGCTQTFVIFDVPTPTIVIFSFPLFILRKCVKNLFSFSLSTFDNWSDKLLHKVRNLEQGRPEVVESIDEKSLDVGTILVLIGHDQKMAVPQALGGGVLRAVGEPQDLDDVLDLLVVHDLLVRGLAHVQRLALEGEDAVEVAAHDGQAGDGQRLGRVALREDERALVPAARAREVRVVQLRHARQLAQLPAGGLLQLLALLELGPAEDGLHERRALELLQEGVRQGALRTEGVRPRRQGLLGLGVERRVLDEAVDVHAQVAGDQVGLDLGA